METDDPVLERHFRGHRGAVTSLAFNPSQKQLASGSKDSTIMIWNFRKTARAYRFYGHKDSILDVCYSPSGQILASASADRTVRLWTPALHGTATDFYAHTSSVRSIHFSPDGHYLVTGSNDKSVKIWAVGRRNKFVSSIAGHGNWVRCARFSPDGRLVASCSNDRSTRLYAFENGSCRSTPIHTFMESRGTPQKIAFHPSGTCVAVAMALDSGQSGGSVGGAVKVYDIRSYKLLQYYAFKELRQANDVTFHPCGNYLAAASDDSTVKIMDLLIGALSYTLHGHSGPVLSAVFSSNGENFATGGEDNQILIWKTKFDKIIDSLCSKVTLRNPIETLPKRVAEVELSSESENGASHVPHCIDARQSVLNPVQPDIPITDVSPASHTSNDSDIEVLEVKKEESVEGGAGDAHRGDESCSGNCVQTKMLMKTILNMNEQIETLRQTVTLLEQRLTLVEDQINEKGSYSTP